MNSKHPLSLKHSIAYSQALIVKPICLTVTDLQKESEKLTNNLLKEAIRPVTQLTKRETLIEQTYSIEVKFLIAKIA